MTKIKLCGLSRPEDIEMANRLMPDYIGFVFAEGSKRRVDQKTAAALKRELDPAIKAVGVFVNERPMLISNLLRMGIIDAVQFHGSETDEDIISLRRQFDVPILRAIQVHTPTDVLLAERSTADYILLDAGAGAGETFNWKLTKYAKRPFFLAGGLTPENVAEAIRLCHPYAVDVSSGIETNGVKDPAKAEEFVHQVRQTEQE